MIPKFFPTQNDFRRWLEENHDKEIELVVGFYKVGSGKPSMTWSESVDQALCFGWIDGVRRSVDKDSYCIRFTPRREKSIWSAINIKKVEKLTELGLMHPAGVEAFKKKDDKRSKLYSFEQDKIVLAPKYEKQFKKNKKAWLFFQSQVPSYRKPVTHWIMSARKEETRIKRLDTLIRDSEAGVKIAPLRRPGG